MQCAQQSVLAQWPCHIRLETERRPQARKSTSRSPGQRGDSRQYRDVRSDMQLNEATLPLPQSVDWRAASQHAAVDVVARDAKQSAARHRQTGTKSVTPAIQNECWCHEVLRMPRKVMVTWSMSPSAAPAMQSAVVSPATSRIQAHHRPVP